MLTYVQEMYRKLTAQRRILRQLSCNKMKLNDPVHFNVYVFLLRTRLVAFPSQFDRQDVSQVNCGTGICPACLAHTCICFSWLLFLLTHFYLQIYMCSLCQHSQDSLATCFLNEHGERVDIANMKRLTQHVYIHSTTICKYIQISLLPALLSLALVCFTFLNNQSLKFIFLSHVSNMTCLSN